MVTESEKHWAVYQSLLELENWVRDRGREADEGSHHFGIGRTACTGMAAAYEIVRTQIAKRCRTATEAHDRAAQQERRQREKEKQEQDEQEESDG